MNDRFITFTDSGNRQHTVRVTDIQMVGVAEPQHSKSDSYVMTFGIAQVVPMKEAVRVRSFWIQEG